MPRPPRLVAPSTVYHVIVRCNNKEQLLYETGEPNAFVDLIPSFEGLARTRQRAARMFAKMVEGDLVKQDDSWTKTRVLGTEQFVKKVLGWTGKSAADPPQ